MSLLCEAAELEHGLACSYLYAAFSLRRTTADGLRPEHVDVVDRWRSAIVEVAEQEMLHLALVCNLLSALGAAPHLSRPPMPQSSPYYPAGMTIELRRFDDSSLTRFIFLERPDDVDIETEIMDHPAVDLDDVAPAVAPGALGVPSDNDEATDRSTEPSLQTVGHLYKSIEAGFDHLATERGESRVFIGPPPAQATNAYFALHDLVPVTDLASARNALHVLTTQGEGVRGDWTDAHYGTFLAIRDELRELQRIDPSFDPAWPSVDNPTGRPPDDSTDPTRQTVDDPTTIEVMALFDSAYTLMTLMLLRFFAHTDESEAALRTLAQSAVDLMEDVIEPLGSKLAHMPASPTSSDTTGGAGFDFYRSVTLLPHREPAWAIFHERLVELAAHAEQLSRPKSSPGLAAIAAALTNTADNMQQHLTLDALNVSVL